MPTLELRDVKKSYAGNAVVHGVRSISTKGEFVVIVGPSAAARARCCAWFAGLEEITGGEIAIDGPRRQQPRAEGSRHREWCFQNYALYPHMERVRQHAYGLKIRRMSKQEIDDRVREGARCSNSRAARIASHASFSAAKRQRVAMGRAIVRHPPKVFLFDEPRRTWMPSCACRCVSSCQKRIAASVSLLFT